MPLPRGHTVCVHYEILEFILSVRIILPQIFFVLAFLGFKVIVWSIVGSSSLVGLRCGGFGGRGGLGAGPSHCRNLKVTLAKVLISLSWPFLSLKRNPDAFLVHLSLRKQSSWCSFAGN